MYEVFEHTADLGLRVRAGTLDELFAEAARALFSIIVTNLDEVQGVTPRQYEIDGDQYDYLLFDWLNELLYTFDTERLLFSEFATEVGPAGLTASCRGESLDAQRHQLEHEVKAITYHGLSVRRSGEFWLAEVIVDI